MTSTTLQLQADSTIDLGDSGANQAIVQFADSHSVVWTGGPILRIRNWTGSSPNPLLGGGLDEIVFGVGGLSSNQLTQIHFTGYTTGAQILASDGEIVPSATSTVLIRGDINENTHVNVADISALEGALSDLSKYQAGASIYRSNASGAWDQPDLVDVADLTGDNLVNNLDLQGMINYLANNPTGLPAPPGGGSLTAVPEPATLALFGLGGLILAAAGIRRRQRMPDGSPCGTNYERKSLS